MKIPTFFARRFVAGETAESAVGVGRKLNGRGIKATFDLLGEDVKDREAARRCAEANQALLRLIPPEVERNISIKLTMMGLDIATDFCLELTAGILDVAREVGGFVRIDMEGSKHTQRTIDATTSRPWRWLTSKHSTTSGGSARPAMRPSFASASLAASRAVRCAWSVVAAFFRAISRRSRCAPRCGTRIPTFVPRSSESTDSKTSASSGIAGTSTSSGTYFSAS